MNEVVISLRFCYGRCEPHIHSCLGRRRYLNLTVITGKETSKVDPLTLHEKISRNGLYQDVCINDLEVPVFEVLPSLKRLKQCVIEASRGQYDAVIMSGSGSTIVGIGSPDLPQFICDDKEYQDVFLSEAGLITREVNQ